MTVQDIITRARYEMRDESAIDYTDAELINYYNDALHAFNLYLINLRHDEVVSELTVTNGIVIPTDYFKFVGEYPIYRRAGHFYIADASTSIPTTYFKIFTPAAALSATFPLSDQYATHVVKGLVFWALNKHSFDMSQDKNAIDTIQKTMAMGLVP